MNANDTTERTRAITYELLKRFGEGDPERIAALFAETVDWRIAPNPAAPWIRPRSTRADVAAHFRELAAGLVPEAASNTVEVVIVEGTEAVVTGVLAGVMRATGKPFRAPFALRMTIENEQIVRWCLYEDGVAVAAANTPD